MVGYVSSFEHALFIFLLNLLDIPMTYVSLIKLNLYSAMQTPMNTKPILLVIISMLLTKRLAPVLLISDPTISRGT